MLPAQPFFSTLLVALDIDGTVLPYEGPHEGKVSPRLRAAVKALLEDAHAVVLASGRMPAGVMRVAQDLGLSNPLIAQEGSVIMNADGSIVHDIKLERELALAVSAYAREAGCEYQWFGAGRFAATQETQATQHYTTLGEVRPEYHPEPESLGIDPNGVTVVSDHERSAEVHRALTERYGAALHLLNFPSFTVAQAPEGSKGNALATVARDLGIARSATLAIGDGANDVSMLSWAGRGLATGKADHWAQEAADDWLPDEVDAVAKALEALL